jgi:hypothetical protein
MGFGESIRVFQVKGAGCRLGKVMSREAEITYQAWFVENLEISQTTC